LDKIILRSGNLTSAVVSSTGGTVTLWEFNGQNILWPQNHIMVHHKSKLRGGIPVCSPWFSKPKLNGRELPQHGYLRLLPMTTFSSSESETTLMRRHEPTDEFPYAFTYITNPGLFLKKSEEVKFTVTREFLPL